MIRTKFSYKNLYILVACEESQAVTIELRKLGHQAFSCDLLKCSGGHPEWHLQMDAIKALKLKKWNIIIAFPPCTDLAVSGAKHFIKKRKNGEQQKSIEFFMEFANAKCSRIAIENPISIMSTIWRKPNQIIQPYQFGHPVRKSTCLWLKNLPCLKPTKIVEPEYKFSKTGRKWSKWFLETSSIPRNKRSFIRSKTFAGIAEAMAKQWTTK